MQLPAVSVLVVDDHPALRAGLEQLLTQEAGYSAYVDDIFAVPATLAQADAIASKNDPVEVLLTAIDAAAGGESQVPPPDPELIEASSRETCGRARSASSARCRRTTAGKATSRATAA